MPMIQPPSVMSGTAFCASEFSASAYDKVYEAPRPELFFKSLAGKVSGPTGPIAAGPRRPRRDRAIASTALCRLISLPKPGGAS